MKTALNTILGMILLFAMIQVAWLLRPMPEPANVPAPQVQPTPLVAPEQDPPIQFEEAYKRYVDHLVHTKYKDRRTLEVERLERHLSIIKEQLEVQRKLIEEAQYDTHGKK